jgi:predicted nucleotidyltransferase
MPNQSTNSRLETIAAIFLRHGVRFIVIGGQAEYLFGSPRVTFDVDLCYERSDENLKHLESALKEIGVTLRGAPPGLPFIADARTLKFGSNFTFDTPVGPLDLLGYVEPIGDFDDLMKTAGIYHLSGQVLQVIDLDDLIRIKRHINREKDQQSLIQLLAIKKIRSESGTQ